MQDLQFLAIQAPCQVYQVCKILDYKPSANASEHSSVSLCRNLVADIGVDLELRGTAVTDHVNFAKSSVADHTLILSDKFVKSDAILGNFTQQVTLVDLCPRSSCLTRCIHPQGLPAEMLIIYRIRRHLNQQASLCRLQSFSRALLLLSLLTAP